MKKLLLLLLLSLGFFGKPAIASDVYICNYDSVLIFQNDITSDYPNPALTLIVDRNKVTAKFIHPATGNVANEVFKIIENEYDQIVAFANPSLSIYGLNLNPKTGIFGLTTLVLGEAAAFSGKCY